MASQQEVKQFLAYWLQVGKKLVISNGRATICPQSVVIADRYSDEFEELWRNIISSELGDCYLEGTQETLAQLLTPAWELTPCVRCTMPVAVRNVGMPTELCPCNDLSNWPNMELPLPRDPVSTQDQLKEIRDCLLTGRLETTKVDGSR